MLAPGILLLKRYFNRLDRYKKGWKAYVFILTYLTYVTYHLARRPNAVVKNVLNKPCNFTKAKNFSNLNQSNQDCGWEPFNDSNANDLFSVMDSIFLFSYAFSMYVSGIIADRSNLRIFLSCGCSLAGVFTCLSGVAYYAHIHVFAYFIIMQLLAGALQSTGWPAIVAIFGSWFGESQRGLCFGIWNSHLYVGNICGVLIAGYYVQIQWGLCYIVPGALMIAMGMLLFLGLVPHPPDIGFMGNSHVELGTNMVDKTPSTVDGSLQDHTDQVEQPAIEKKPITFLTAVRIPGVVGFAITLFCVKFTSYSFMFWLPRYEQYVLKINPKKSAFASVAFDVGGIIGGISAGILYDSTGCSATTCAAFILLVCPFIFLFKEYGSLSPVYNFFLQMFCGIFVDGPYALITTAVSAELGSVKSLGKNLAAMSTVTAIIDGTGSIGAAVGPLVAGPISELSWSYVFYGMMAADILAFLCIAPMAIKEIRRICYR